MRERQPALSIAALTAAIVVVDVIIGLALRGPAPWDRGAPFALVALTALVVAAEYLVVPFRHRGQVDTWNLMEAALAPLLFGFAGPTAMIAVAAAQLVSNALRRNAPLKLSFNVAQWVLAAGVGSAVFQAWGEGHELPRAALAAAAALAGVAFVNQAAMTIVLAVAKATSPAEVVRQRGRELVPGALVGWSANALLGLLFVFALDAHASAVVLFPVPLVALHIAYRSAAVTRIERFRQVGIQEAIRTFGMPLQPVDAIEAFVDAVGVAFDARTVCVAIASPATGPLSRSSAEGEHVDALTGAVLGSGGSGHVAAGDGSPIGAALRAGGWRSCIYVVCSGEHARAAIVVADQEGPDLDARRDLALLAGLTREALRMVEKGQLVRELDDERRSLAAVVAATSDGIATIDVDGVVRSWNPAFERLAGLEAAQAVGASRVFARLHARTLTGARVDIDRWATGGRLPRELRITAADGEPRRLMCSYSRTVEERSGSSLLVVVARDVTAVEEMDALRAQFARLVEVAPRARALPSSGRPQLVPVTAVARTELAVDHPGAARAHGGVDPYDWYVLPDGNVHFVALTLTGHDVRQMEQAIGAIQYLRVVADEGGAFDDLTGAAHDLFGLESGIADAAVVGRYRPDDGRVELAGVGGAKAVVVTPHDGVHELALGRDELTELRLGLGEAIVLTSVSSRPARSGRSARSGGERSLADRLDRAAHLPAAQLVATVLASRAALARPESLALALRRTGGEPTRAWKVPPSVEAVGIFRREIVRWLRDHGVAAARLDDVAVVVSELLTNAVEAARTSVEVHALFDMPTLELAVSDDGVGFEVALDEVPDVDDLLAESGRGLHIVDALAATWTVRAGDDGATVRAQLCVGEEAPAVVPTDVVHPTARNLSTTRSQL